MVTLCPEQKGALRDPAAASWSLLPRGWLASSRGAGAKRQKVVLGESCPKRALRSAKRKGNHPSFCYCGLVEIQFTQESATQRLKRYAEFKTDYVSLLEGRILYSLMGRCKEDYYGNILPQAGFGFFSGKRDLP